MQPVNAASRSAPYAGVEPALASALADELVAMTALLSDLACELGNHPETLRRHMAGLQAIDLIAQTQSAIADVLRATTPSEGRLAAIPVEALATSLLDRVERYRSATQ